MTFSAALFDRSPVRALALPRSLLRVGPLLVITAFALGVRLYRLGERSLWQDEISTYRMASVGLQDFPSKLADNFNMSLYYTLLSALVHALDGRVDEALLRLPSVIFGTLTVLVVYDVTRRVSSHQAGLLAAACLAFNVYHIVYSQEARGYTLFALMAALSWLYLLINVQDMSRSSWVFYVTSSVAGVYTHYFAVLSILTQFMTRVVVFRSIRLGTPDLLAAIVIGVMCLPIVFVLVLASHIDPKTYVGWISVMDEAAINGVFSDYLGPRTVSVIIYGVLFGLAISWVQRRRGEGSSAVRALVVWCWLPLVLLILIATRVPILAARYVIFVLPAMCAVAGIGLSILPRWQMAALALPLVLSSMSPLVSEGGAWLDREDWRGALRFGLSQGQEEDAWLFLNPAQPYGLAFYSGDRYLDTTRRPVYLATGTWQGGEATFSRLDGDGRERGPADPRAHRVIWLVVSHDFRHLAPRVQRLLREAGYAEQEKDFDGVELSRFSRSS